MNKRNERKQKCKERNEKEICFFETKVLMNIIFVLRCFHATDGVFVMGE